MFQGMEYVYEVYKEKSFSKAAANLFISQPSLSANVKRVENRIGYPIFDRSTKPLGLTECGKEYIRCVEEILGIHRSFSAFIHDWDKLSTGSLTLGGSNLFSSWILPPLISAFVTCHPHIKINLIEESTAQLAELLQKGSVDLILDNTALNPDIFDSRIFHEEHLILAVPSHFPINSSLKDYQITDLQIQNGSFLNPSFPIVPLKSFKGLPFIMMKNENDTGKRARQICQANDFEPDVVLNIGPADDCL